MLNEKVTVYIKNLTRFLCTQYKRFTVNIEKARCVLWRDIVEKMAGNIVRNESMKESPQGIGSGDAKTHKAQNDREANQPFH